MSVVDLSLRLDKLRDLFLAFPELSFKDELLLFEEARRNPVLHGQLLEQLEKKAQLTKKYAKQKKALLQKYTALEKLYTDYFQAMRQLSAEQNDPKLIAEGKELLAEVFKGIDLKILSQEEIATKVVQDLFLKISKSVSIKNYSRKIQLKKNQYTSKNQEAEPPASVTSPAEQLLRKKSSFMKTSARVAQKREKEKEDHKDEDEKEEKKPKKVEKPEKKPEERVNTLLSIERRVKEYAFLVQQANIESGYAGQLQELLQRFMMNMLEQIIRYSSLENEGHQHVGSEFRLFEKKPVPSSLELVMPFSKTYIDPYSVPQPRKRRIFHLYKVPVVNPLEEYGKILESEAAFQTTMVRELSEEFLRHKNRREIERDVYESLFSESKNLEPESYKLYQRALSLSEHGQKPQNKRLTIRITAIQVWLEDKNMPHLLEKSYFK